MTYSERELEFTFAKNWKKDKTREIPRNSHQNIRNSREFPPEILGVRDSQEFPGIPEREFPVALYCTCTSLRQ